ncbi:hypothetical protein KS4_21710 [Poriferisphaera corsica]|uniref:Uncharacterized protein n=1 Tax=Poriferisphaera corsica TaxID=2528020 RepID=A0A517YV39_9BACT|nr:hypothetical protein [Poriferisphaera corsica]QDU34109.1 hypothetical protein KS4_21710 [Poriferisphaera corsica]
MFKKRFAMTLVVFSTLLWIAGCSSGSSKQGEHNYKELHRDRPRFETEPEYNSYQHYGFADPKVSFVVMAKMAMLQETDGGERESAVGEQQGGEVVEPDGGPGSDVVVGGDSEDQTGIPAQSRVVGGHADSDNTTNEVSEMPIEEKSVDGPQNSEADGGPGSGVVVGGDSGDQTGIPAQSRVISRQSDSDNTDSETNAAVKKGENEVDKKKDEVQELKNEGVQADAQEDHEPRGFWKAVSTFLRGGSGQQQKVVRGDTVEQRAIDSEKIGPSEALDEIVRDDEKAMTDAELDQAADVDVPIEGPHGRKVLREGWGLPQSGPVEDWTGETREGESWARANRAIMERSEQNAATDAATRPELDPSDREKVLEFEEKVAEGKIDPEENVFFDNAPVPYDEVADDDTRTVKLEEPSGVNFPGDTSGTDILWPEEMTANMKRLQRENWPPIQFAPVDGRTVHLTTYRFGEIPLGNDTRDPLDANTVAEQMGLAMGGYKPQEWNNNNWQGLAAAGFRTWALIGSMPIRGLFLNSPFDHVRTAKIDFDESSESPKAVLFEPGNFNNTLPGTQLLKKGDVDNPPDPLLPQTESSVRGRMMEMGTMGEMETILPPADTEEDDQDEAELQKGIIEENAAP